MDTLQLGILFGKILAYKINFIKMGRNKKFTEEELNLKKVAQNRANYNRILALESDQKRFNKCCEVIERFLLGVEALNKHKDEKISVNTMKIEMLLQKAKAINLNIQMENSLLINEC
jgi:hypothetical protein